VRNAEFGIERREELKAVGYLDSENIEPCTYEETEKQQIPTLVYNYIIIRKQAIEIGSVIRRRTDKRRMREGV